MQFRLVRVLAAIGMSLGVPMWPAVSGAGGSLLTPAAVTASAIESSISKQQADMFSTKLTQITRPRSTAPGTRRIPVTEGELNSWFAYNAAGLLPAGISAPHLTIVGDGKVAGQATVDLDALGKRRSSGGTLDPWSYLTGKVPLRVVGALRTVDGMGRFEMESADVSGIPVPKTLLQQLLTYYSRSAARPAGISLDDSFPLPADIRKIEVGQGQAVVVQ